MIDFVLAAAAITGPAHVTLAAWQIDEEALERLGRVHADRRILSVRLLCAASDEGSEIGRRAGALFGAGSVSFSATHAKVATVEAPGWALFLRGSTNARAYSAIEQIEIEDSPDLCAAWRAYTDSPARTAKRPGAQAPARGRAALAAMPPGGRLVGLTDGFSTVNLLAAALERCGPACEVEIIGYRIAPALAEAILAHPNTSRVRALVSPAFRALSPRDVDQLFRVLGVDQLGSAWTHGRWFTVRGADRAVTVHTSANLNSNLRVEQFDASEETDTSAFFSNFHAAAWDLAPKGLARCSRTATSDPALKQVFQIAGGPLPPDPGCPEPRLTGSPECPARRSRVERVLPPLALALLSDVDCRLPPPPPPRQLPPRQLPPGEFAMDLVYHDGAPLDMAALLAPAPPITL